MIALMILFEIPEDFGTGNERKKAETIEGETYNVHINQKGLLEHIHHMICERHPIIESFRVLYMSDFMDMINDEEINMNDYWMSYVYVNFTL